MNKIKLLDAQARFFLQYPGGFSHPDMLAIAKKHKLEKMNRLAQENFALEQFDDAGKVADAFFDIVKQSSLVSVFEKVRVRELADAFTSHDRERLAQGLREFLHGDQESGFETMADLLGENKLAKWPLLTVCPTYFRPDYEVFIKPTTAKRVIDHFELEGLKYSPSPTFAFYRAYREQINQMKKQVDDGLQVENAAFCGFLMLAVEPDEA